MACSRTLTWGVQVLEADGRRRLGRQRPGGDHRQLLRRDPHDQLGQQRGELWLRPGLAGRHLRRRRHPVGERSGDVLERAVLQQPREEQVPRLDEGEVLVVCGAEDWGRSRAALMSSSVAATRRNSDA